MKIVVLLCVLIALSCAQQGVIHEVAGSTQHLHKWTKTDFKFFSTEIITLGFAIKQQNLQKLEEIFYSVSDPHSPDFGNHLTIDELGSLVGAQDETLGGIQQWLKDNKAKSVTVSRTRDYVWGSFTSQEVETLLNIKLSVYSHQSSKSQKIALITRSEDPPVVPSHLAPHIDFISGLWHFPETERLSIIDKARAVQRAMTDSFEPTWILFGISSGVLIDFVPVCASGLNVTDNGYHPCADYGNPITSFNFTYAQFDYNKGEMIYASEIITSASESWPTCSLGIYFSCQFTISGLLDDSYVENSTFQYCFADGSCTEPGIYPVPVVPSAYLGPQDVRQYYGIPQTLVAGSPKSSQAVAEFSHFFYSPSDLNQFFKLFDLPTYNVTVVGTNYPLAPEPCPSLDLEFIMGVGQGVSTYFWYNAGRDWIAEWAQSVLNTAEAPKVHTISYSENEQGNRFGYYQRADIELQKLGAAGHSIFATTGDYGSGYNASDGFSVDWPASSPYVTAVGATRITRGATQECQQHPSGPDCSTVGEVAYSGNLGVLWATGGGFSKYAPRPSYQDFDVSQYLKGPSVPNRAYFNSSGRAYPDVVAVNHNLKYVYNGQVESFDVQYTYGSTPIVAGLIALINDQRLQAGKSTIGFLNQWLYSLDESAFYDVTVGDTISCYLGLCSNEGFYATPAWDPVSGLGSLRFPALLKAALALP